MCSSKEVLHSATDVLEIEKESIMAKQALLFPEFNMRNIFVASTLERCCYFLLLPRREQDVASNTQNESRGICERLQASDEIGWWFIAVSLRYRVDISRLLFLLVWSIRQSQVAHIAARVRRDVVAIQVSLHLATVRLPHLVDAIAVLLS